MVTDKPLRPRSCAGPIRAGVRRRDIFRHYTSVYGYLLITGPSPRAQSAHHATGVLKRCRSCRTKGSGTCTVQAGVPYR